MRNRKIVMSLILALTASLLAACADDGDDVNIVVNEGDTINPADPGGPTTPAAGEDPGPVPISVTDAELQAAGFTLVSTASGSGSSKPALYKTSLDGVAKAVWRFPNVLTTSIALDNSRIYTLDNGSSLPISVGTGNAEEYTLAELDSLPEVTLTVEAGTEIVGNTGDALVITRGSRIVAEGVANYPVIFHSDDSVDPVSTSPNLSGRNEWGGLVIQGFGRHNSCDNANEAVACNVSGEGNSGYFGGYDNTDDSGILRYVIVAEAGEKVGVEGDDLNGIGFMGVGSGTTVEYVQVHDSDDDGVEFFGGAVNIKYLVVTGAADDSVDWDEGWQGNMQFVLVKQSDTVGDHGMETDSAGPGFDSLPRAKPTLANLTLIGGNLGDTAILHRRGTGAFIHNSIIYSAVSPCLDVDVDSTVVGTDEAAFQGILDANEMIYNNVMFDCPSILKDDSETTDGKDLGQLLLDKAAGGEGNIILAAASLDSNLASTASEAQLSTAVSDFTLGGLTNGTDPESSDTTNPDNTFLTPTDYLGAIEPGTNGSQFASWIIPGTLGDSFGGAAFVDISVTDEALRAAGFTLIGQRASLSGSQKALWRFPNVVTGNVQLDNSRIYSLDNGTSLPISVGVGNAEEYTLAELAALDDAGAVLTIEKGTEIVANGGDALVITRGSRIIAAGTADEPIIFHSDDTLDATDNTPNLNGRNEWGGLVIQGFGRHNSCDNANEAVPCNVSGEGNSGFFGGYDNSDSSGILQYVIVAEGGEKVGVEGDDLNGIGFMGVGSGTVVDHIQIHDNDDDGVEFFGGAVNLRYVVLTGNNDDSIDWDEGWQGNMQFVIVKQSDTAGDHGMETDSAGPSFNSLPRAKPTLANLTLLGGDSRDTAILHRRGTGALMHNSIIVSPTAACLDIDIDDVTLDETAVQGLLDAGELVYNHVLFDCATNLVADDETSTNVDLGQLLLDDPNSDIITGVSAAIGSNYASAASEAILSENVDFTVGGLVNGTDAVSENDTVNPDLDFLQSNNYLGAVDPLATDGDWFSSWIVEGSL